jgi:hypothetical protein
VISNDLRRLHYIGYSRTVLLELLLSDNGCCVYILLELIEFRVIC